MDESGDQHYLKLTSTVGKDGLTSCAGILQQRQPLVGGQNKPGDTRSRSPH